LDHGIVRANSRVHIFDCGVGWYDRENHDPFTPLCHAVLS
jgi:hypothetical protein